MDFQDAAKLVSTTEEERVAESNQVIEKRSRHPIVAGLLIGIRVIMVVGYVLFDWLLKDHFVIAFSVILLLAVVDFWVTKNISGRLLVGLRWWNQVDEDGTSRWIFEALEDHQKVRISYMEMMIFWGVSMATPIVWFGAIFLALLFQGINYIILAIICLVLSAMNLIGFIMCARGLLSVI